MKLPWFVTGLISSFSEMKFIMPWYTRRRCLGCNFIPEIVVVPFLHCIILTLIIGHTLSSPFSSAQQLYTPLLSIVYVSRTGCCRVLPSSNCDIKLYEVGMLNERSCSRGAREDPVIGMRRSEERVVYHFLRASGNGPHT
ncbi:hypothetical protein PILCRDRAFT_424134 [Piloderma croceum F 1598]|uniref:Uncharacterized protein n=1 Tax=Piloderma croceum (strain F 1598) TaxID=765440 RepID=A0A0C3BCJ2_PILCF|nr:hypothetical protein PILCRDRAFT_424134 [Piloderma croceum F 1598]